MRVLLTGARAPVTLDLARRFDAAGAEVFLADSLRYPLARFSRVVRRFCVVPSPVASPEAYVESLLQTIGRHQIDWLVPTCEEVFFISAHLEKFQDVCRVLADRLETLDLIHNKWLFSRAAEGCGAEVPETHELISPDEMAKFLDDSHQWVFKPTYSRFASETLIGPDRQVAARVVPSGERTWIAQRRVEGVEHSTYSIANRGQLLAHVAYVSRYRAGRGSGIFFEPRQHAAIEDFVRQFVARHQYTGQIGFDFIVGRDDRLSVLEGNPRATSGLHLFADADPLVATILNPNGKLLRSSSSQSRMVGFAMPLWGLWQATRQLAWGRFVRDSCQARDVMFSLRDPLPLVMLPVTTVELVALALRHRKKLQQAATDDIEWNGEPL